jgi:copper(I)-binding protein
MSTGARLGILAGIVVVAIVALVIAGGGSDNKDNTSTTTAATTTQSTGTGTSTSTTTTTTSAQAKPAIPKYTIVVKNAKPVGGVKKIKVNKGDQVALVVKSDTADEIHVHGYDLKQDVAAGGSAAFKFKATIDGAFEIELENHGEQIAELTVEP